MRASSVLAVAAGMILAASSTVFADDVVQVSGADPFAGCVTSPRSGTNFPNTRVEPYVAVNPATMQESDRSRSRDDGINLVGVWQQDRWSSGGARGLVAAFSFDGGQTWGQRPLPFNRCAPGGLTRFERASDPWVSIGPDGTAYVVALSISPGSAIAAVTSTDGGRTWTNLRVLDEQHTAPPDPTLVSNDKETVTADPLLAGVAYAVWIQFISSSCDPQGRCAARTGPVLFSKTMDGGRAWTAGRRIVDTAPGETAQGNQIVIDSNTGALYDFFNLRRGGLPNLSFVKSLDGGQSWTAPQVISDMQAVTVRHPATGEAVASAANTLPEAALELSGEDVGIEAVGDPIRTGALLPEAAIDPHTGRLYVVWEDSRFTGGQFNQIALVTSGDGGFTWSRPVQVNRPQGVPAFTPMVQVNDRGIVGVTFYDFRNFGGATATLPTDYWIAFSNDGGATFEEEEHVAGPFNILAAPTTGARGFFLGDYQGLATAGESFLPFFIQTSCLDASCAASTDTHAGRFDPKGWLPPPQGGPAWVTSLRRSSSNTEARRRFSNQSMGAAATPRLSLGPLRRSS